MVRICIKLILLQGQEWACEDNEKDAIVILRVKGAEGWTRMESRDGRWRIPETPAISSNKIKVV